MTNRERVIDAIHFRKTDYVPYSIGFTMQEYEKLVQAMGEDYVMNINNHIAMAELYKPQVEIKPGYFRDEYGVIWNKTGADKDIGMPDNYLINDLKSFEKFEFPEIDEGYIRGLCENLIKNSAGQFTGVGIGFSMFERLWTLMGMEDSLYNMLEEPELIHRILNKICERNLAVLSIALNYKFDFVYFGDDWGQQKGLIMGPDCWREFIKPQIKKMYALVKSHGCYVMQHSCGDVRDIFDDLYEIGLNIYQTFQPEIYGLDYRHRLYNKVAIWGGISTQHDLPYKSPNEIKNITRELLDAFKGKGGLIASPTHSIPGDVPVENVVAMLDVLANQ